MQLDQARKGMEEAALAAAHEAEERTLLQYQQASHGGTAFAANDAQYLCTGYPAAINRPAGSHVGQLKLASALHAARANHPHVRPQQLCELQALLEFERAHEEHEAEAHAVEVRRRAACLLLDTTPLRCAQRVHCRPTICCACCV